MYYWLSNYERNRDIGSEYEYSNPAVGLPGMGRTGIELDGDMLVLRSIRACVSRWHRGAIELHGPNYK